MRVHIGTDHAGFAAKTAIVEALRRRGYEVVDHGAEVEDPEDDYPDFVIPAAEAVAREPGSLGIVLGGSGNGEAMAANLVRGIRCALIYSQATAELARQHNDANVAAIGGRQHSLAEAVDLAITFLTTDFSGEPRHQRRIDQLTAYETAAGLAA
ncbi:MAG: ribose-5-phosphate isomerase [Propionibacteriaceae bacterium]|nr:ribose-5-phosphate isomerase [Propionibacteriaceae bacterium]